MADGEKDVTEEPITIVAACDEAFAQHLAVMLSSLLDTNRGQKIRIFILSNIADETFRTITNIANQGAAEFVHIRIDPERYRHLPRSGFWSDAIYYRLGIGTLLSKDISRVLYLDCDIVINASLVPLWTLNLEGHVLGAVEDKNFSNHTKLGLPERAPYFNSGVMLIDLARWRDEAVEAQAMRFLQENVDTITNPDQCALNRVLAGQWLALDEKWNFQTTMFCDYRPPDWLGTIKKERLPDLYAASIIHYSAQSKPWHYLNDHPLKHLYWKYLGDTPWRGAALEGKTIKNMSLKHYRTQLPALMLMKYTITRLPRLAAKRFLPKQLQRWIKKTFLRKDPYNLDAKH